MAPSQGINLQRIAAFSEGDSGGNPAGVVLSDRLPDAGRMQQLAAQIGYSETAFAAPEGDAWRVRYFAPDMEVPFCGHATLALSAALARAHGAGTFDLRLNAAAVRVEAWQKSDAWHGALWSPPTRSQAADHAAMAAVLDLFGLNAADLDQRLPAARIHAGADHFVLALKRRETLAAMRYDFASGQRLMREQGWITIMLVQAASDRAFHARNAFAAGGVYEDPATGAAAAAFAGYLRDLGWPHGGAIQIEQGVDMGVPARLHGDIEDQPGSPIRVHGRARWINSSR